MMTEDDSPFLFIAPTASIREAMACIDRNQRGIVLVVEADRTLLGTITDGDVRRAMLAGLDLESPVSVILERKANTPYPRPVSAPVTADRETLLQIMRERSVRQIPLLDEAGRVVEVVTQDDLLPAQILPLQAVIMAGGFGTPAHGSVSWERMTLDRAA